MNIENDYFTFEINKGSVTVVKNGKYFKTIGAVNVVSAFVDQGEIVLEYYNPRLNIWSYQTYDFSVRSIQSGGGRYKLKRRSRHRSSANLNSDSDQEQKSGGSNIGLVIFLLLIVWAIFSPDSPDSKITPAIPGERRVSQ